ncbi:hypothetical protein C2S53_013665 [Perilla frutescens var. hirtella]|uniref:Uncharacterized protein n=1 Tax=Perilla frutescens var. hirtella TaxID=608512 RepID=A0AAD4J7V5_PERFH|nr:hypothetical protein C2S53_013665 [Perilla frutescens var. hirtella]
MDEPDPSNVPLFPTIADVNEVNKLTMEDLNEEICVCKAQDSGEVQWMKQLQSGIANGQL